MNKVEQKTNAFMQGFLSVMVIFLMLVCVMLGIDLVRRYFEKSTFLTWPQFLFHICNGQRHIPVPPKNSPPVDKESVIIFKIDADYVVLTYAFTDGSDLDTRTRVISPDIGQDTQKHIGWGQVEKFPDGNPIPILEWGGDNTGTGVESVKIDLREFRKLYPSKNDLKIDCRAFWYGDIGRNEVNIEAVFSKGGEMIKEEFSFRNSQPNAETSLGSTSVKIEAKTNNKSLPGERIATFQYNLSTGVGQFDARDTPSP